MAICLTPREMCYGGGCERGVGGGELRDQKGTSAPLPKISTTDGLFIYYLTSG